MYWIFPFDTLLKLKSEENKREIKEKIVIKES